jgi:hypothetical protein
MQGLQALDQFKSFVSKIGGLGRYEDTYIVHAAEGETVIPMEVLDQNPVLKKRLFKTMMDMGIEPGRYIVGNELNSKNPVTGQPEFFLKKLGRRLRKAAADISGYAAPIVGAMYGPAAGAAVGGILGQYKRENPGDPTQGMAMALRGGLSGAAANLASGQGAFLGKGARGAYGMEGEGSLNPLNIGKRILGMESKGGGTGKGMDFFKDFKNPFSQKELTEQELMNKIPADLRNQVPSNMTAIDKLRYDNAIKTIKNSGGFAGMSAKEMLGYGLPASIAFAQLIKAGQPEGDDTPILEPKKDYSQVFPMEDVLPFAKGGGVMDLQDGGESKGPGTGTSDSIPAMLSDGEFVMTAKAVRGAGGGDRREGARKMYEAMDRLEASA